MAVSIDEMETTINFCTAETEARIYSSEPNMLKKLAKLAEESSEVTLKRRDHYGAIYVLPKSFIRIAPPRKVNMSVEQRQALRDKMRSMNAARTA
ncbi:MAG: hypothetical protein IKR85_06845 [Clostridia bacterium]|nr:hypothetical protein [Clostridia bacterium]